MKDQLTTDELSVLLGVSAQTIRELARRGVIAKSAGRTFPTEETVRRYLAHLRGVAHERGGEAAIAAGAAARARLATIRADREEFALEVEREQWLDLDDVIANWDSALRTLRAGVLTIPTRVASRVPGLTRDMVYEMDQEIREILTELGRNGYPAAVVEERKPTL